MTVLVDNARLGAERARWLLSLSCAISAGVHLALVPEHIHESLILATGFAFTSVALFATAVCGGETARRKPHPEPLLTALGKLAVPPAECAYVGDSPEDVAMARAAGALAVGIPGGFPNREALRAASPDLLFPSLDEAVEALLG